jgi:hypothetical protein
MSAALIRAGALAGVGGFLLVTGLAIAFWDSRRDMLVVAAVGGSAIVLAFATSRSSISVRGRYFVAASAAAGVLLYPTLLLIWFTWFYDWP